MGYREQIIALNPIMYWRCHEASVANPIVDEVNPSWSENWNTQNDFAQPGPTLPDGSTGTCIHFKGVLNTGSVAGPTAVNNSLTGASASMLFYFKHDATGSDPYPNIFGHSRTFTPRWAMTLEPNGPNPADPYRLFLKRNTNSFYGPYLPNNVWHHYAVIYDRAAGEIRWFINGGHEPAYDAACTALQWDGSGGNLINNESWQFGTWDYSNERVAGSLSEVALFNYALGDTQIGDLLTGNPVTSEPGTVGDVATISPAPERLPHRFSWRDFPGLSRTTAASLARKFNENFDATQRVIDSLDPDQSNNQDNPYH